MTQPVLAAYLRKTTGKGAARKLRKNNQVPAVFYGPGTESVMLALDYPELEQLLKQAEGENIILDLQVKSEGGTESKRAMLKDLQVDPVKDTYIHADFYEISMDKEITVAVPIQLINIPIGVTNGGVLQHIRRELTITCLPDKLIDAFEIDVSGLDIGDSIHIQEIELPEGIITAEAGHLTVAVMAAPTVEEEVEEVEEIGLEEEAAEPEGESAEEAPDKEKGGE
ncbi:MAG: 50S ribosomal protein L25 [Deltaproteobacteria bacterium]|nr:50S ribosomal protein L25 [Deltaproteobacteria bacterium]MBW2116573.1 50S ribosomal protein L25 [Deltaproteobacteria bacterium]MBW2344774.1 50S ribosomal protein L25 [Deltaproteobacteria bacterium]